MTKQQLMSELIKTRQENTRLKKALSLCYEESSQITCSREIADRYIQSLAGEMRERFYTIILDNKHRIIEENLISIGTLNQSLVHPRECFSRAVEIRGAAVLFLHNHPSGDVTPSTQDIEITKRLKNCGEILGINVLDHVIVGAGRYLSFVDEDLVF